MSNKVDGWIDVAGQTDGRTSGQLNKLKQRLDDRWIIDR